MILWDIELSIIYKESMLFCNTSLAGKGIGNSLVPELLLAKGIFDPFMNLHVHGHDKGMEVLRLEDNDIVIILLALVMVVTLG